MSKSLVVVGIDFQPESVQVVRAEETAGRLQIMDIELLTRDQLSTRFREQSADVVVSIPDRHVSVRPLFLPLSKTDSDDCATFELLMALGDEPAQYRFETIDTGRNGYRLGLVARRNDLAEYRASLFSGAETSGQRCRFLARAVALGRGYLTFCRRGRGEFICLVDLCGGEMSICLVYGDYIVGLARLDISANDVSSAGGREHMAVDLKTLVNFQVASLLNAGITIPLSALLLGGSLVDDDCIGALGRYFPVGVDLLQTTKFYSSQLAGLTDLPPHQLVVALGLVAN
ncbi:MAG: hypothetical protein ACE5FH_10485 [Candidatus Zixiibacteriota bacterium]